MSEWVTDLSHLPPVDYPGVPPAASRRAAFVRQLVEAATSRRIKGSWCSAVRCIARTGRTKCGARIHVARDGGRIQWSCPACGEGGLVTGFEGSEVDFSEYALGRKKAHMWGFDDESLDVLRAETTRSPDLRAVLARARPADFDPVLLLLEGTVNELDLMYTLVEELLNTTRSRNRIELLKGLRASLSTSIDGF